jgi:ankyrin repeat domain-containing protein 50
MRYREDEVQEAYADSCGWILTHEVYKNWINDKHGLLWIKGKPGSGKSTLMKRIYKETTNQSDIRLAFFFHRRGVQLQQTSTSMLRTMSHQLISQSASARAVYRARYHEKKMFGRHGKDWDWHDVELRQALKDALVIAAKSHSISIFIDALDEAGEISAQNIVSYIYEVHEEA